MGNIFSKLFSGKKKEIYFERDSIPDDHRKIKSELKKNKDIIDEYFNDCFDVVVRDFYMGSEGHDKMSLVYINGLTDKTIVQDHILKPLMIHSRQISPEQNSGLKFFTMLKEGIITAEEVKETDNFGELVHSVLSGDTALLMDKQQKALIIGTKGWEQRGITEPTTESVIRGPKDSFTENFLTNMTLIRRRLKDPNLKAQNIALGRHTRTTIGIVYIRGIAKPSIVDEVLKRLNTIDIDRILESGHIEQLIQGDWLSPFPQMLRTERPDVASACLLEGNVVIICDNTPFVIVAPTTLMSLFQAPDDYYENWHIASALRVLRLISAFLALTLPGLYIAMTAFHPGMLPTDMVYSIAASREGVPFSATIEAFFMLAALEMLREAGARLPSPIGQTIGIVGGLVLGDAAVSAGIVSPIMVIIIALNAISSFTIPLYNLAVSLRLFTFVFIIFASIAGLYGIVLGFLALTTHLVTLKSFGSHYLSPFISFRISEITDTVIKGPLPTVKSRPGYTRPQDWDRMNDLRQDTKDKADDEDADK